MSKKIINLGDYIDIITDYHSGGSYEILKEKTKILYEPDYAVMIRTLNFENNDFTKDLIYCDKSSYDFLEYSHVRQDDILMNKIANAGSVYKMPKVNYKCTCGMNLFLIRANSKINQKYLFYIMKCNEKYIKKQAHGTTTKTITKDEVRKLKFEIETDPIIQNKIVEIIENIDNQISRNNDIVQKLQVLAQSTYSRWFNQFEFLNKDGLPYKSNCGEMVYNEILKKEIPEGWRIKELGDILEESDKSKVQVGDAKTNSGKFPFFTSGEEIILYKDAFVDGPYCYLNTGGNADVKFFEGKSSYSTDTWCISFDKYTYMMKEYLLFIKPSMDKLFFSGSGLKHLQKEVFKKQKILIPNDDTLNQFNKIVEVCNRQSSQLYLQNIELNNLKSKLLPLLINGQLEV